MDYVEEGRKYCLTHGSKYHNPYPRGTDEHNQFERGWSQALKMYPEKVARIDKKRNDENGRYRHQMVNRKSTTTAEAYRNAKGK
jgi:hypothetical protein